ncbi:alpha/beta hydrolase [Bacillus sp. AK031]
MIRISMLVFLLSISAMLAACEGGVNESIPTDSENRNHQVREKKNSSIGSEENKTIKVSTYDGIAEYRSTPSEYKDYMDSGGTIEKIDYAATYDNVIYDKHAYVYLPAGYDASGETVYDIFYLMHGGSGRAETFFGGEGKTSSLKNILDHMIEKGDIEPLIVVTPTYYNAGSSDDVELTHDFHKELLNALMPAVEGTYHTYAPSIDTNGFRESREHRAFGGFSMGSVTTWYTFIYNLDYYKYYLPMSGDSWILGMMGGHEHASETAEYLSDVVENSNYDEDDYFIYAATGTADIAYDTLTSQIEAMKSFEDTFIYGDDPAEVNLHYSIAENGAHTYAYMNDYIYNALPYFFGD